MANLAAFNSAAFLTTGQLAVAAGATIEVRREDTSALASIFSNEAGTTPITNPSAFADSSGRFKFYVAGIARGFSIQVTKGAETFTLRNVAIGTAAQYDVAGLTPFLLGAERQFMVNIKDYGALGDDSADDTSAISAAIAVVRAYASPFGGIIFFPRGIYRIGDINATGLKNVRFIGECGSGMVISPRGTVLRAINQVTTGKAAFDLTASLDCVVEAIQIVALTAAGAAPSIVPTFGFMLAEASSGDSNRVILKNVSTDGHFSKAALGKRRMSNCTFENCTLMNRAVGGHAYYNGDGTTVTFASLYQTITSANAVNEDTYINCEFHGRFEDTTQTAATIFFETVRTQTFIGGLIDGAQATASYIRAKGVCDNVSFNNTDTFASDGANPPKYGVDADAGATLTSWLFHGHRANNSAGTAYFNGGAGATAPGLSLIGVKPKVSITGNLVYYAATQQIVFGASSGVAIQAGANRDIGLGAAVSANPGQVIRKMHANGILCNMQTITDGVPAVGSPSVQSYTFTLHKNLAAQSLQTVQIGATSTAEDITHLVSVTRGDSVFVQGVGSAGAAANNSAQITMGFIPTD